LHYSLLIRACADFFEKEPPGALRKRATHVSGPRRKPNAAPLERRCQYALAERAADRVLSCVTAPARPSPRSANSSLSRAQLYNRIHEGALKPQKDGARTYTRGIGRIE